MKTVLLAGLLFGGLLGALVGWVETRADMPRADLLIDHDFYPPKPCLKGRFNDYA